MSKYVNQMVLNNGIRPPKTGRERWRVKGTPGLYLQVSASGHQSWVTMYRVDGTQIKETLAGSASVGEAVAWARGLKDKAEEGVSPRDARRQAEAEAAKNTVAAAVEDWFKHLKEDKERKPTTLRGYRQLFDHDILPRWGDRPIRSISDADVLRLLHDKRTGRDRPRKAVQGGAGVQSNRLLVRLKTFFRWCTTKDPKTGKKLVAVDPTSGIKKLVEEKTRERVLSAAEIAWFWAACDAIGDPHGPICQLLLLTAQRLNEVAGLEWSEIDLERRMWTLPRRRTKSDRGHLVHLSDLACDIINGLPRKGGTDLVFPSQAGTVISAFSKPKTRLDALMTASLREATGYPDAELEHWTLHDLRRSATTLLVEELAIQPAVADKILNHSSGVVRGVMATYNRAQHLPERKAALEALGRYISTLVQPGGAGNVVPLRA